MFRSILLIASLFLAFTATGQDSRLAQQYYSDGEFEKAAVLYEKLFQQSNYNDYYFDRYVECLLSLEEFDECEKVIKKQLKRDPENVQLYVTYGKLFERQVNDEQAEAQYQKAIELMPRDQLAITKLANAFTTLAKYDLAIETYEKGAALLKDSQIFAYNLGELYRRKGDSAKMAESYLNSIDSDPARANTVKAIFQRYLLPEDYEVLKTQLYSRIQSRPDNDFYPEMLSWVFIQQKDYQNAFRQLRALDRRLHENGGRVYRLGEIASNDKDYEAAIQAYEYIVRDKGPNSTYYIDAKREALRCKRKQLVDGYDYTREALLQLEAEYDSFLDEFGRSKVTANIILEEAELEALYLNDLDKAIAMLSEMIEYPNVNPTIQAYGKINLADYYLMKGEIWEATLLYSQVDKAFKEDPIGHEARFRNAKLSYYSGDFQWAQAQFDILKASTSKLIANDALDLSVFIMDNLGLDTTATALQLYADAELLVFQNRFGEAFQKLDSLRQNFPSHTLQDDLLYLEAQIYKKKRDYTKAAELLQKIVDEHKEEIRADNALYELAQLYEKQLNDPEKAMALYETLFIDYSGSTFAVEARKRYRQLRGDNVQ
ncbi:MAG: tetratricopeptide repeat protein [Phaeodactylibacter sp.]|nr:tetratricopeptide repeat protein [Phaeodactylibacter sp.]MCB9272484.1 tetratricopeptide repeat protein [Lewinellaceae bacterium]